MLESCKRSRLAAGSVLAVLVLTVTACPRRSQPAMNTIPKDSVDLSVGQGAFVRIRGPRSVSVASEPLFIVDGVYPRDRYSSFSSVVNLNPSDIKRIEIIRDSAATMLYGTDAYNGVVLIFKI